MKKIKFIKLLILSVFLTNCTNYDFGDINVDPNNPSSANPQALMSNSLVNSVGLFQINPVLYVQYLSQTQYTETSLYQQSPASFTGIYRDILNELEAAIQLNTDPKTKDDVIAYGSNNNQIAILQIYKAFIYAKMTDTWGDIPYTEALNPDNITPVYDDQEVIYKGIIATLKTYGNNLNSNEASMIDLLYKGDVAKWKKFANSLRMVYALRLSKRYPSATGYAATEFKAAFEDAGGYIATNADNAAFDCNDIYKNPWQLTLNTRRDYAPSNTFIDKLNSLNDKRLEYFATKTSTNGDYVGVPYGLDRVKTLNFTDNNEYSLFGEELHKNDTKEKHMTAAQVNFAIAEAISRNWIAGNAQTYYNNAIRESYLDSGLSMADYNTYIAGAQVAFDPAKAIEMISTQRWIGLYPNGLEAWNSWRRTGYPVLTPAADALNNGTIPLRYLYPSDEYNINGTNLDVAVGKLSGGDVGTTPIWWSK